MEWHGAAIQKTGEKAAELSGDLSTKKKSLPVRYHALKRFTSQPYPKIMPERTQKSRLAIHGKGFEPLTNCV